MVENKYTARYGSFFSVPTVRIQSESLQFYDDGNWNTICIDLMSETAVFAVCRSMDYAYGELGTIICLDQ